MNLFQQILGIGAQSLTWYQTALRSIIVYIATLIMVRIGERRFLGKNTSFDVVVGIILGSLVSTAINSQVPFLATLLAGFVVVGLHWLFSLITFQSDFLDVFLKGSPHKLVNNGEIVWNAMKKNDITREDLTQAMRKAGHTEDVQEIREAYFERSGDISFIKYKAQPRVLEVKVEKGVQTVRIIIEP